MDNQETREFFTTHGCGFSFDGSYLWIYINNSDKTIKDFLHRQNELLTFCTAECVKQTPIVLGDEQLEEQETIWKVCDKIYGFPCDTVSLFRELRIDFLGKRQLIHEDECCTMITPEDEFTGREIKRLTAEEFVRWVNLRCDLSNGTLPVSDDAKVMFEDFVRHEVMSFNPGVYQFRWRDNSTCCNVSLSFGAKTGYDPKGQIVSCSFTLGDWSAVQGWTHHLESKGYKEWNPMYGLPRR